MSNRRSRRRRATVKRLSGCGEDSMEIGFLGIVVIIGDWADLVLEFAVHH